MIDAALRTALRGLLVTIYHATQTALALLADPAEDEQTRSALEKVRNTRAEGATFGDSHSGG